MSLRFAGFPVFTGFILLTMLVPNASADSLAYAELSNATFGIQDLTTGTFTILGSNTGLDGLGEVGTALYGVGGSSLYSVNPANGALTSVGTGATPFIDFGSTTAGLFGLDSSFNLYSINSATGTSTLIGPTSLPSGFHSGLSAGGGNTLFH